MEKWQQLDLADLLQDYSSNEDDLVGRMVLIVGSRIDMINSSNVRHRVYNRPNMMEAEDIFNEAEKQQLVACVLVDNFRGQLDQRLLSYADLALIKCEQGFTIKKDRLSIMSRATKRQLWQPQIDMISSKCGEYTQLPQTAEEILYGVYYAN